MPANPMASRGVVWTPARPHDSSASVHRRRLPRACSGRSTGTCGTATWAGASRVYLKFAEYFSRKQRAVMPAQAGIQGRGGSERAVMDSRLRGHDENKIADVFIVRL